MSKFTTDVAKRFVPPCEQEEARLWARFEPLADALHHLRNAQAQLHVARTLDPAQVPYWERSVCAWIDRAYRAQNNVDMYRAFVEV